MKIFAFFVLSLFVTSLNAQTYTKTYYPKDIKRLYPKHVGGDREFGGHGPKVYAYARISISSFDKTKIVATLSLDAKETRSDWTHAKKKWTRTILSAPKGYEFVQILSDKYSSASYTDNNHHIDRPSVRNGRLVKSFEIMGDTRGNDVGNNTSDDVFMNVYFNGVRVKIKKCTTSGPVKKTFTPRAITRLSPKHVGGDREFGGHGPDVNTNVRLRISSDKKRVEAVIYLHAKETQRDWTEARGSWTRTVWTAPTNYKITKINSSTYSEASYRDNNHHLDRPRVKGGSLVNKFEVMGDTRGNDVGNNTSDDVFLNVYFNQVSVTIQK